MHRYIAIGIIGIVVIAVFILILYLLNKDGSQKISGDKMKKERMVNENDQEFHDAQVPYSIDHENMTLYVNDISKKDFDETFSKYKGRLIKFIDGYKQGNKYSYMIPTVKIDDIKFNDQSGQTVVKFSLAGPIQPISPKTAGSCQFKLCYGPIYLA